MKTFSLGAYCLSFAYAIAHRFYGWSLLFILLWLARTFSFAGQIGVVPALSLEITGRVASIVASVWFAAHCIKESGRRGRSPLGMERSEQVWSLLGLVWVGASLPVTAVLLWRLGLNGNLPDVAVDAVGLIVALLLWVRAPEQG